MRYGYVTIELPLKEDEDYWSVESTAKKIEEVVQRELELMDSCVIAYGVGNARNLTVVAND